MHANGPGRAATTRRGIMTIIFSAAGMAACGLAAVTPAQARPAAVAHRSPFAPMAVDTEHDGDIDQRAACAPATHSGRASCFAVRLDHVEGATPHASRNAPYGYGPASLQRAYSLPTSQGAARTVAIIDAYDNPNAESDLATYRRTFGLPSCTTANGCFKKISQNGGTSYPSRDAGWAAEISLDLDMVSAICPRCHILLVEATSSYIDDLGTAVNRAVSRGAKFVSNSYGASEYSADATYDSRYYNHPGVAITASAGDGGYAAAYPAASR